MSFLIEYILPAGVPGPARDHLIHFCLITSIFLLFSKLFKNIDKINGAINKAQKKPQKQLQRHKIQVKQDHKD